MHLSESFPYITPPSFDFLMESPLALDNTFRAGREQRILWSARVTAMAYAKIPVVKDAGQRTVIAISREIC